jgi:endogenous inhibitor of DNA gyrase (YacG/DUF329 family)
MNEKKTYERNCPYCGKLLTYKSRPVYNRAKRIGRGCRGCGQSVVKVDSGYKSSWNVGLTSETDDRVAYNCRNAFGKDGNVSFERKGKTYEEIYGKERAIEIKKKQTLSTNVDKWVWPKYNPKSIPIIEKYGEETGYSFKDTGFTAETLSSSRVSFHRWDSPGGNTELSLGVIRVYNKLWFIDLLQESPSDSFLKS